MHLIFTPLFLACIVQPDPNALLQQVDAAANRATDMSATLEVAVSSQGAPALVRTMKVWQKGDKQRLLKFMAPARLRGTGILVADGRTHLYLPAYRRVRRVAGKEGGGSFMGMGFSINDLARVRFSKAYSATVVLQDALETVLKLTPNNGSDHKHAWLQITVRKSDHLVKQITAHNAAGKLIRTITMSDFRDVSGYTIAHHIEIVELSQRKKTVATLKELVFDTGLSDADFTERQLKRAP
ncbi:MAG TPA: outer membrane lipoprotein-sorting protein [Myxococcales bacterium]|nr:outer membrane lipoprotein-sorting protein [Myxococcales bacterium]HIN84988.1 outer membrane lipoprotein-sorting protein [Myxococcales bacterium]